MKPEDRIRSPILVPVVAMVVLLLTMSVLEIFGRRQSSESETRQVNADQGRISGGGGQ